MTLHATAETALGAILIELGVPDLSARLASCPKPELGDAATGVALQAARPLKRPPMAIASEIADRMAGTAGIFKAQAVSPGYVNLTFSNEALAAALLAQAGDSGCGILQAKRTERVVIDFGGANIKPLHCGHMRSLFLGESLRRILLACGHDVISDIHLGDWGLPSGMILAEIRHRFPAAPWFQPGVVPLFPAAPPVSHEDLATLYPTASAACKSDLARMAEARATTAALQAGDPGLRSLWAAVVRMAKTRILGVCDRMGAHFDLTLGESDAQPEIPSLLGALEASGMTRREGAALLIDLAEPGDKHEVPPLVLEKEDGSALYATTDLATVLMRRRDLGADRILYVVDNRQTLHFQQVFRAAAQCGLSGGASLEHIGFGTVNGSDGKPFRTRSGGLMPLEDLLGLAKEKARERLEEGSRMRGASAADMNAAADAIGLAALRIADLSSHRQSGYVLDIDRTLSFEGRTGPHLLYALVRLRAILAKVGDDDGPLTLVHPAERRLALVCLGLGPAVMRAAENRTPHELVSWAFDLAAEIGRFYVDCPVVAEPDPALRASRSTLCRAVERALAVAVGLIGCNVPAAM